MSLRTVVSAILGALVAAACGESTSAPPGELAPLQNRGIRGEFAEFSWHAGDAFLAGVGLPGPDIARAPNGETMEISGSGMLSVHAKSISGGGTFVHKDASGGVIGTGTWEAVKLQSFQSYGTSPCCPSDWTEGKAVMRIKLMPDGGGPAIDGTLWLTCVLPGGEEDNPGSAFEGVTLTLVGGPNFNEVLGNEILGFSPTLFIRQ